MHTLRKELRPDFQTAERLYRLVIQRLEAYEHFVDAQSQDTPEAVFQAEYTPMEHELSQLSDKDLSQTMLWEWWEENGIEVLAFDIAMPAPQKHPHLTKEDLYAFVKILKENEFTCENNFQE